MKKRLTIYLQVLIIVIGTSCCSLLMCFNINAESLNDKVFCISNPETNAQIITKYKSIK